MRRDCGLEGAILGCAAVDQRAISGRAGSEPRICLINRVVIACRWAAATGVWGRLFSGPDAVEAAFSLFLMARGFGPGTVSTESTVRDKIFFEDSL